jgi:hypothetical protein
MPLRASPVLRRNYEALRLPRVKYPHKVNSMHEELLNKLVRRKEEILPLPIQERKIRRY